jgi:uncharacterized membrane protein YhaH (DUF805 family)
MANRVIAASLSGEEEGVLMNWLVRPWKHAFDFSGRSPRREWALFVATYYLTAFLMLALAMSLGARAQGVFGAIVGIWLLACVIPWISLAVRRLHDHDKSGWLLLIAFIPAVGWIFYLIMMLTNGNEEANSYGPNPRYSEPLGDETAQIFA